MNRPSPNAREPRHFICQSCGCEVTRYDGSTDNICLNCWYGGIAVRVEAQEIAA